MQREWVRERESKGAMESRDAKWKRQREGGGVGGLAATAWSRLLFSVMAQNDISMIRKNKPTKELLIKSLDPAKGNLNISAIYQRVTVGLRSRHQSEKEKTFSAIKARKRKGAASQK